jgi:plastocyanin
MLGVVGIAACTSGARATQRTLGDYPYTDFGLRSVSGETSVDMEAGSFYFKPTFVQGTPGQRLTLHIRNTSAIEHNIAIASLSLNQTFPAQSRVAVEVQFPASGALRFFCTFHVWEGMNGELLAGDATPHAVP